MGDKMSAMFFVFKTRPPAARCVQGQCYCHPHAEHPTCCTNLDTDIQPVKAAEHIALRRVLLSCTLTPVLGCEMCYFSFYVQYNNAAGCQWFCMHKMKNQCSHISAGAFIFRMNSGYLLALTMLNKQCVKPAWPFALAPSNTKNSFCTIQLDAKSCFVFTSFTLCT